MKKRQDKNRSYKALVYELIIIFSIILIILILAWLIIIFSEKRKEILRKEGELGNIGLWSIDPMTGIAFPEDCNDSSLITVWDSVFRESSNEIIINKSQAVNIGGCSNYLLYKIKNNQELFLVYDYSFNFIINTRMLFGLYLNASPDIINNFTYLNSSDMINNLTAESFYNLINDRYIDSQANAVSEFSNRFMISSSSWQYNSSSKIYSFNDSLTGNNLTRIEFGLLFENKSLDYFIYMSTDSIFQFLNINNLSILKNSDWNSAVNLNNIFTSSLKLNYSVYNLSGSDINYIIENSTLKFKPKFNFTGNESFKVMAYNDSNYLNSNIFKVSVVENNNPPEFIQENCNLTQVNWYKNENYSLDISNCFRDLDWDNLIYKFFNISNLPLTIVQTGTLLKLIPRTDWFGSGSFQVYANDSINETEGRVYFTVKDTSGTTNPGPGPGSNPVINRSINQTIINDIFKIKEPSPSGEIVTDFFGKNQTFFILNTIYDSLEWYLDGKSIKNNSNTFKIEGLSIGNHTVEVKIRKGIQIDSKVWKVAIVGDEKSKKFIFDAGLVMFYVILIVVAIIIMLVFWLFIEESRHKNKISLDLKIIDKIPNDFYKKDDMSRRFNIPK